MENNALLIVFNFLSSRYLHKRKKYTTRRKRIKSWKKFFETFLFISFPHEKTYKSAENVGEGGKKFEFECLFLSSHEQIFARHPFASLPRFIYIFFCVCLLDLNTLDVKYLFFFLPKKFSYYSSHTSVSL